MASSPKRAKLSVGVDGGRTPRPPHVCQLCDKAYERLDHLNRHLDSHRNERTFKCSQCPQSFNRRDLLLRHEASHAKNAANAKAGLNRASERAVKACDSCVVSKLKCDNSRPCQRCRKRKITCETKSLNRSSSVVAIPTPESDGLLRTTAPSDPSNVLSPQETSTYGEASPRFDNRPSSEANHFTHSNPFSPRLRQDNTDNPFAMDPFTTTSPFPSFFEQIMAPDFVASASTSMPPDIFNTLPEMDWFNDTSDLFGMDFTPTIDNALESQLNDNGLHSQPQELDDSSSEHINDSAKQRHAIFQRSLWLWKPELNQNAFSEHSNIPMSEQQVDIGSSPHQPYLPPLNMEDTLSQDSRDRILQLVVKTAKSHISIPSFPSVSTLNILLKVGIAKRLETDAWIHPYTFESGKARPELLTALIAAGCVCFGIPRVSKTGLVLFEIVRVALNQLAEEDNSVIRDLQYLQACMIWIDVTAFCGFQRKMQIAESSLQPLVTALRRTGKFDHVAYSSIRPSSVEEGDALEAKWRRWVEEESYKRLVHHLFEHDMYTTISKERNPLISYAELSFPLPAARDLWLAPSAEVWQMAFDTKATSGHKSGMISMRDLLANAEVVKCLSDQLDLRIAQTSHLSGLAAQCWEYFQQSKVVNSGLGSNDDPSTHLWMQSRHQKLYQSLQTARSNQHVNVAVTAVLAELLMMSLHVSLDEITRFAGKCGENEAHRAYQVLQPWSQTKQARTAVWHAGQVVRLAREVPPFQLRGADSLMMYHAIMVLWAYGLMQRDAARRKKDGQGSQLAATIDEAPVFLDEPSNERTNAFLLMNNGRPCLHLGAIDSGTGSQTCDLRSSQAVMAVGIAVLEGNLPNEIRENLPQLIRSLCELMKALGNLK